MKKLSIYLVIIICLFITGCGSDKTRVAKTLDEFETAATGSGFSVTENEKYYSTTDYIIEAKIATYDEIEVEIIKYSDSETASKVQEQHIESFNLLKSTGAYAEKEKGSNYYDYALISNGRYMVSTRVDDTLIFAKVFIEEREMVESLINSLGY